MFDVNQGGQFLSALRVHKPRLVPFLKELFFREALGEIGPDFIQERPVSQACGMARFVLGLQDLNSFRPRRHPLGACYLVQRHGGKQPIFTGIDAIRKGVGALVTETDGGRALLLIPPNGELGDHRRDSPPRL